MTSYTYTDIRRVFLKSSEELRNLQSIPNRQRSLKPTPNHWSVDEILHHIILFNKMYQGMILKAVDLAQAKCDPSSLFKPRWFIRPFIKMIEPPYKFKLKTLKPMQPASDHDADSQNRLNALIEFNQDLISYIKKLEAQRLHLDRIKERNKVFKIKMTVTEFLLMMAAHQNRHIWQIQQLMNIISKQKT